jgi:hypothetical protein
VARPRRADLKDQFVDGLANILKRLISKDDPAGTGETTLIAIGEKLGQINSTADMRVSASCREPAVCKKLK